MNSKVCGDVAMRLACVGKNYPVGSRMSQAVHILTSGRVGGSMVALRDISLELAWGDALAIVGRNGAGKSTLLQIACGTLTPTAGSLERFGRVAAMLELGAGFKPDFTGRENVFLNASIYGLGDEEIERRFDSIADFAEIGAYMDRPVAEYSSGMFARLAFAVCAHVDADILVVDEVLAVGDVAFQAKCRRFMEEFLRRGAILFVSHDEHLVMSVCNRAIWLDRGFSAATGKPEEVLRAYRHAVEMGERAVEWQHSAVTDQRKTFPALDDPRRGTNPVAVSPFRSFAPAHGDGSAVIDDVYFADSAGVQLQTVQGGGSVTLVIVGRAVRDLCRPIAGFIFRDRSGQNMFGDNTYLKYRDAPVTIGAGQRFRATLVFDLPFLPNGTYSIAPSLIEGSQQNHVHLFWMEEALLLTAHNSPVTVGKIGVPTNTTVRMS